MDVDIRYFDVLGYSEGMYLFLKKTTKQVVARFGVDVNKQLMIELAPIQWWEESFPCCDGVDESAAINWLFRTAECRGVYEGGDINKLKGQHRKEWLVARQLFRDALKEFKHADSSEKFRLAKFAANTLLTIHIGECNAFGIKFVGADYVDDKPADDPDNTKPLN